MCVYGGLSAYGTVCECVMCVGGRRGVCTSRLCLSPPAGGIHIINTYMYFPDNKYVCAYTRVCICVCVFLSFGCNLKMERGENYKLWGMGKPISHLLSPKDLCTQRRYFLSKKVASKGKDSNLFWEGQTQACVALQKAKKSLILQQQEPIFYMAYKAFQALFSSNTSNTINKNAWRGKTFVSKFSLRSNL